LFFLLDVTAHFLAFAGKWAVLFFDILLDVAFFLQVASGGAGFASGRPSFLLSPKKEGKKCDSGASPLRTP